MKIALSIAGSDPTGGAGLQADLQVFRALGVHGMAVVTALTVQDTGRVHEVLPVFPSVVLKQLRVLLPSTPPDALKLGARAALVKGGHRDGAPDDLLALRDGGSASFHWLVGERIPGADVHGTGCALSAAITAHLARGAELRDAVESARRFVRDAIRNAQARLLVY